MIPLEVGAEDALDLTLANLVRIGLDAVEARQAVIDRLIDDALVHEVKLLQEDHERHVRELSRELERRGGSPPQGSGNGHRATEDFAALEGRGDDVLMDALIGHTAALAAAHERALARADGGPSGATIARVLADLRRHRARLERRPAALTR